MTDISKPIIAALKGERVDPPPIWLMRQAGRYLQNIVPYVRRRGGFLNLCYDPEKAAEVTLQPLYVVSVLMPRSCFQDILVIPHALGKI